ncbi:Organic cation/carnitine transporter 4 [Acorus calamus]|uniref:H(+)/Pi cotransporter n=1 Tax=Acorus calamus TaxID=4465 RepID=A0AAV9DTQ3_ACOCL|nr:Organic cation/carnitine transporter 4 [Acorus calamus]
MDGPDLETPLVRDASDGGGEGIGIDEMLERYAGEFGPWQLRHFVLTSLAWLLEAFHTMVMIFADRQPDWVCVGPGCRPGPESGGVCGLEPGSWEWVGGPSGSTVSEFGLVCGDKYKVGLAQSAFFGGCMVGAGVFGHLSDSFLGRKGSLTTVCILCAIFGCLTALSPTYWAYALLRFLTGLSAGGVGLCAFVLATEPIGPSKRGPAGMSTFYFFSGGIALLSAIAYAFNTWRTLYLVTSLPALAYVLSVLPFLSESPRWYLVRGRTKDAMHVMHSIAARNGKRIPDGVSLILDDDNNKKESENAVSGKSVNETGMDNIKHKIINILLRSELLQLQYFILDTNMDFFRIIDRHGIGSLVDVMRSPVTRRRLILTVVINFMTAIVYYGLSLNVVNLGTNVYLNVALNAVAEMPAFVLTAVLLNRLGRKPMAIGTMLFSGGFCLLGSLLSSSGDQGGGLGEAMRMGCGVLGIFGMAATYNLLFIYVAELFPTTVRNAALGCATQAGHLGAIFAPMVVVLGGGTPFAVFGVSGIVGGLLVLYLPETLNQRLYDTIEGMK